MRSFLVTFIIIILTACSPKLIPVPNPTQIPPSTQPRPTDQELATPDRMTTNIPERIPQAQISTQITGEVPLELIHSILEDLANRAGVVSEKISIIQAQEEVWNDGSLGCPQPGTFYTQALVSGYWVILEIDRKKFDYRATDKGYFFLCEDGIFPISPPDTPSS